MPKVRVQGIELYYEVHGKGDPLVLIRGFGSNADHWYCQVPAFSPRFKVVVFDNRGVGRSEKSDIPYTIRMMAEDTGGLIEELGIPKAHVLGISMGGMIAQEMALRHPEKVNGLVLACTHCGGNRAVSPSSEVTKMFADYTMTGSEEAGRKVLTCLFTERTLREKPEVTERYREVSNRFPPDPRMLFHQFEAIRGHDMWEELVQIKAPTLVLTGDEDVLIPPENARILTERIPGARLQVIPGGAHQFILEQADAFNRAVMEFLDSLPA